ncbi:MAG: MauE/DoxX family redox-associated membrane protein [Candidatus Zixiibacteriota bacterium]
MRKVVGSDYVTMAVRLTLGITFVYASYYKLVDPSEFARSIWYYHLMPGSSINLLAIILPWLELLCGLCLIAGIYYRGAIVIVAGMTVVFIIAMSSALMRGINLDCGCFKASGDGNSSIWQSILFDMGLLILAAWLWYSPSKRWKLGRA